MVVARAKRAQEPHCLGAASGIPSRMNEDIAPDLANPKGTCAAAEQCGDDLFHVLVRHQDDKVGHPRTPLANRVPRSVARCQSRRRG